VSGIADASVCRFSFGSLSRARGSTALFLSVEGLRFVGRVEGRREGGVRRRVGATPAFSTFRSGFGSNSGSDSAASLRPPWPRARPASVACANRSHFGSDRGSPDADYRLR
jgi:hypothetical protein